MKVIVTREVEMNGKTIKQTAGAEFPNPGLSGILDPNRPTIENLARDRARALFQALTDEVPK